ncbi:hypothetical protein D3C75_1285950 [compost metagenome]
MGLIGKHRQAQVVAVIQRLRIKHWRCFAMLQRRHLHITRTVVVLAQAILQVSSADAGR